MTRMLKLTLCLSAAAMSLGAAAYAQVPEGAPMARHGMEHPGMDKDLTRAEAQQRAEAMFAKLDVNHDGKLDKADRQLMRQQHREQKFAELDTNHDGMISKAEFMAPRGHDHRGPGGDKDGPPRMGHGMKGHHMKGPGHMGKDGAITEAEFVARALKRFDMMDTNHDGTVTKAERQAMFQKMRMERKGDRMSDRQGAPEQPPAN